MRSHLIDTVSPVGTSAMNESPESQSSASNRYGLAMVVLTWVTALGLATMYFQEWLEERDNPNRVVHGVITDGGTREVTLERNRQGHYLATGDINGRSVRFMIDTGATTLGIPAGVAEELGLEGGRAASSHTAGGRVQVFLLNLDSVGLGNIQMRDVRASIIPDMPGEEVLLGMSFLKHLEIVQKNGTMTLRQN